ncbi:MAG: hypothetical protein ACOX40_04740 [Bacilli bacterium]|jgi:hypothetical protein
MKNEKKDLNIELAKEEIIDKSEDLQNLLKGNKRKIIKQNNDLNRAEIDKRTQENQLR